MSELSTLPIEDTVYAVAAFNGTIFAARQTGVFSTSDGGNQWNNLYEAWMPDTIITTLAVALSPNFENDKTLITGINGGIMFSSDAGETWVAHQFRNPVPMVTSVAFSPQFESDQTVLAGTFEDGIFRSTDAGKTWQAFNFGLFDHNILCIAVMPDFQNNPIAYVGTSSGIYRSVNGGRLWEHIILPIGYDAILSLAIGSDHTIYAGTETRGLLQSSDGGTTWTTLYETDGAINAIIPKLANQIIIQVDDIVMSSNNNGETWTNLMDANVNAITLSHDKQSLIIGLADTTIKTFNVSDL